MRIGVDVRHLYMARGTGGAHVMLHALEAARRFDAENEYVPYHEGLGCLGVRHPLVAAVAADVISKNMALPFFVRSRKLDALLHFLPPCSFTVRGIPQVAYILDVPEESESVSLKDRFYNNVFIRQTARLAARIITISNFSADQIVSRLGVPRERVTVIYPCIDQDLFKPPTPGVVPAALPSSLAGRRFILGVLSNLIERKNPGAYARAYAGLPADMRREVKLVMAGAPKSVADFAPFVDESTLKTIKPDTVFLGRVSNEALAALFGAAAVVLFPSRYEGFGLPVMEASCCGTPVVCSDLPVLREVSPPGTIFVSPDNIEDISIQLAQIIKTIGNNHLYNSGLREWSSKYSYQTHAKILKSVFKNIV